MRILHGGASWTVRSFVKLKFDPFALLSGTRQSGIKYKYSEFRLIRAQFFDLLKWIKCFSLSAIVFVSNEHLCYKLSKNFICYDIISSPYLHMFQTGIIDSFSHGRNWWGGTGGHMPTQVELFHNTKKYRAVGKTSFMPTQYNGHAQLDHIIQLCLWFQL